jgi:hypothetical protein
MEYDIQELDDATPPSQTSHVITPDMITEAEYPIWENYQVTSYTFTEDGTDNENDSEFSPLSGQSASGIQQCAC